MAIELNLSFNLCGRGFINPWLKKSHNSFGSAWLGEADAFLVAALAFIAGQKCKVFSMYFNSFEVFNELTSAF